MAAEVSTILRSRPGKPAPKKSHGFLALPGEIRNRIYHYYFQDTYRCEIAPKGYRFDQHTTTGHSPGVVSQKEKKEESRTNPPISIRMSRPLGSRDVNKGLRTIWPSSLCSLILVCKQVHRETVKDFYSRITFVFQAPRRTNNFLNSVSKLCLQNITKMHIHYVAYGDPLYTKDCHWLEKHRRSWKLACRSVSRKLTGLQELEIWVHTSHPAPKFNLGVDWIQPLLQFRRMTTTSKVVGNKRCYLDRLPQSSLKKVDVHVDTNTASLFDPNVGVLLTASVDLHRLFGRAISLAILGYTAEEAMAEFDAAWTGRYKMWQYHLGYGKIKW